MANRRAAISASANDEGGVTTAVARQTKRKVEKPRRYKVLLHNDDYTTMEFVVFVLESVFRRSEAEAVQIMLHVHRTGFGVAGVYTFEIAETRVAQVHALAKHHEYPLRASLEEA